ncbi:MAG: glycoside hydrolase family 127 protein [Actinomycetota bacterium]|nr:glycoside hydrolase family 127 protein [Actinomycetota bacterium]
MSVDESQGHAHPAAQGPLDLARAQAATLQPVSVARLGGGFWGDRARLNAEVGIPSGIERLRAAGNVENLQLAAARATSGYRGDLPFLDSDVYKWLEAAAFAARHGERPDLEAFSSEVISLLAKAQEPDGYLQSYFQVKRPGERYVDLQWGHDLYCAGHLLQAAIARARVLGDETLLEIGLRFVDSIVAELGANAAREGVGGHPEIEMALVELYRLTGEARHLKLAQLLIDRRGHGLLGVGRFGSAYWQDDVPVREATTGRGHAVRQLYLLCGVVDAYLETGEESLLVAAERQWLDIVAHKTYLTGGQGARHTDESFGDAWELPSDRAYCETCAAIGSIMLSWRLLLATGKARYAELIERTLYNGFLSGASLDGEGYRYVNPLQVRHARAGVAGDQGPYFSRWFRCACCPPNVMRLLASLEHYACARRGDGLVLHQFMSGDYGDDALQIHVETGYPFEGNVHVSVAQAPSIEATITLRLPQWAEGATLRVNGEPQPLRSEDGWLTLRRVWQSGDRIEMELPLAVRLTRADSRVDAVRSAVALERGPLVYCVEEADNPGVSLDEIATVCEAAAAEHEPGLLGGITPLRVEVDVTGPAVMEPWWPYGAGASSAATAHRSLVAIPFYAWGNRTQGAMRVWMPSPAVPQAAVESTP